MEYYAVSYSQEYLEHHGIKGMRWGVRRYQNPDGSLTAEGKKKYYKVNNSYYLNRSSIEKGKKLNDRGITYAKNMRRRKAIGAAIGVGTAAATTALMVAGGRRAYKAAMGGNIGSMLAGASRYAKAGKYTVMAGIGAGVTNRILHIANTHDLNSYYKYLSTEEKRKVPRGARSAR